MNSNMKIGIPRTSSCELIKSAIKDQDRINCYQSITNIMNHSYFSPVAKLQPSSIKYGNVDLATVVDNDKDGILMQRSSLIDSSTTGHETLSRSIPTSRCTENKCKYKVVIFADESGYNMRNLLQKQLGDNCFVTAYIKPNAPTPQILSSCITTSQNLTERLNELFSRVT